MTRHRTWTTLCKAVTTWFLILVLAMLNGVFRETVLLPNLSTQVAFILSGILLSFFIIFVALALSHWLILTTSSRCFSIGALWLTLTLLFEFGFGLGVQGKSMSELLDAYTISDGNIWPIVLLVILFAPFLASRLRRPHAIGPDHRA